MSNNKKLSSIEWLKFRYNHNINLTEVDFEEAKAMHNTEMKEIYLRGIANYDPTFKIKDNKIQGGNK
jgi:hypothetical protein